MSSDSRDSSEQAVGDLLRTYRSRAGRTQEELAEAAGVTGGLIGNVERGTRNLGSETVERVADALQLSAEERAQLLAARKRYAASTRAAASKPGPAPWVELLEQQRQVSESLEELRDLLGEIAVALREQRSP